MNLFDTIALVNWELGTFLIAMFFVVCAGLVLIVLNMIGSGNAKE
ncbi:hypothetical protein SAMN04488033_102126 [Salegentibacter agarivorans]|jgi:hypothetical protein|uniref:Uncharacterized protein n=1 Tax=Salegentibacter agarivorans TaxID=345907 RepID=A0A1I2K9N9_9FLAO|nr:hypothetical protein [Salegentibacter agarivorans]SFF63039.1 hypothetical protein SAMN04488033_102126 [Salegentibacter agarivorans]